MTETQMLTIAKMRAKGTHSQPFHLPLRCYIASSLPPVTYIKDGVTKERQNFMVCDETEFIKAISFDQSKSKSLNPGATVILKNFYPKDDHIVITSKTVIFQAAPMTTKESIVTAAKAVLRPATPPTTDISAIKKSPIKSLQSFTGKVIQDESPRQVVARGSETMVRTIVMEDKQDTIKVALWRKFAEEDIKPGDFLTMKSLVVTEYMKEKQLSTTSRTEIKKTSQPDEELNLTLLAFEERETDYQLLCQLDGETVTTFTSDKTLVASFLDMPYDQQDDDSDDDGSNYNKPLEDRLMCSLPGLFTVKVKGTEIVEVKKPLVKLT